MVKSTPAFRATNPQYVAVNLVDAQFSPPFRQVFARCHVDDFGGHGRILFTTKSLTLYAHRLPWPIAPKTCRPAFQELLLILIRLAGVRRKLTEGAPEGRQHLPGVVHVKEKDFADRSPAGRSSGRQSPSVTQSVALGDSLPREGKVGADVQGEKQKENRPCPKGPPGFAPHWLCSALTESHGLRTTRIGRTKALSVAPSVARSWRQSLLDLAVHVSSLKPLPSLPVNSVGRGQLWSRVRLHSELQIRSTSPLIS